MVSEGPSPYCSLLREPRPHGAPGGCTPQQLPALALPEGVSYSGTLPGKKWRILWRQEQCSRSLCTQTGLTQLPSSSLLNVDPTTASRLCKILLKAQDVAPSTHTPVAILPATQTSCLTGPLQHIRCERGFLHYMPANACFGPPVKPTIEHATVPKAQPVKPQPLPSMDFLSFPG